MSDKMKFLETKVGECTDPAKSVEMLICGIADILEALDHDPVAICAMACDMRANAAAWGAAIFANTQTPEPEEHPQAKPHKRGK